ncbi:hypothetical protein ANO14919_111880 [Xylariales sp. No.14919]|nr:hypothetical protein ANO14919_111880 [Xylariales sp. No.14919]
MQSIKKIFTSNKKKSKSKFRQDPQVSSPVEGSFETLTSERSLTNVYPSQLPSGDSHVGQATIDFIPQARGREETIAWLNTDQAAKQIRRGPRTEATKEVQLILESPSCKTVEEFHHIRQQSEIAVRYGAPGVFVYNFSKSLGWNQASGSRLPSLQLRGFETRMKEIRNAYSSIPAVPFSPINWLALPKSTGAQQSEARRQLSNYGHEYELQEQEVWASSPISEPGGWRDSEQIDITNSTLCPYERLTGERGAFDVSEDEGEASEGT